MSDPSILKTLPGARILQAIDRIEQTQGTLSQAAEDLSGVDGFGPEWSAVNETSDGAHRLWTNAKVRFDKGRLDLGTLHPTPPSG
jgi:hypothetical protein